MPVDTPQRRARLAALLLGGALLAGCVPSGPAPSPSPSQPARPFTVTTTEKPATYDPAAATTAADALVALNAFSRLMVVHSEKGELKPDLATDCLYTSATVYECQLPKDLTFHNGHALTASDVKFSIDRALRLGIPGSSTSLLDSLQRVEAVDDLTVRFTLNWADSQFGYALASPAASIVDEQIYDPDSVRPNTGQVIGSGPFQLVTTSDTSLVFHRFKTYVGADTGALEVVALAFPDDPATAEQAMTDKATDAVWRSLTAPGQERLTAAGFLRHPMPHSRVHRLVWNPNSEARGQAELRQAVALSLQADRTLSSLIPGVSTGGVAAFPVGGQPQVPQIGGKHVRLTLSYATRGPGEGDLARVLRDRIETATGASVQLLPDAPNADLVLTDRPAWVNTPFGWLQVYTDRPLPGSAAKITDLLQRARQTTDPTQRAGLLAEIQQQAAADLTVLPISQAQESLFLGAGVTMQGDGFGPGFQLGLWSFRG